MRWTLALGLSLGLIVFLGLLWYILKPAPKLGAKDAYYRDFPFIAALVLARDMHMPEGTYPQGQRWCGAILIDPQWVLTAAHCIRNGPFVGFGLTEDNLAVMLGSDLIVNQMAKPENIFRVKQIIIHPEFQRGTKENDLALLYIDASHGIRTSLKLVTGEKAADYRHDGQKATVVGWGDVGYYHPFDRENDEPAHFPEQLQRMSVEIVNRDDCQRTYLTSKGAYLIYRGMLCATKSQGKDSCDGDSGGPLLVAKRSWWTLGLWRRWELLGVVSWGLGCGAGYPGIYSDIGYFYPWIERVIGCERSWLTWLPVSWRGCP